MCVSLEQELAVVGVINAIAMSEATEKEVSNNDLSSMDITITPYDVINYSNYLSYADCGPIIRRFDEADIEQLFKSKKFIRKATDDSFTIVMEDLRTLTSLNDRNFGFKQLTRALINAFDPDLNHPRRLLHFMDLCE